MNWAWRLGRFLGIDIYISATFPLIFVVTWGYVRFGEGVPREWMLPAMAFVPVLFLVVLMHEYGHALSARYLGLSVDRITLSFIGGATRVSTAGARPSELLTVFMAGPFVNLILAMGLTGLYALLHVVGLQAGIPTPGGTLVLVLIGTNVALLVFNLLPLYPTDGWMIMRSLLGTMMDHPTATVIAVTMGRVLTGVLVVGAWLMGNYFLMGLLLYMWWSSGHELREVRARAELDQVTVRDLMVAEYTAVPATAPIGLAARYTADGARHDYPVLDGGAFVGMLCQHQVALAISRDGPETLVADAMERDYPVATPDEGLGSLISRPVDFQRLSIPVVEAGQLAGLLPVEEVADLLHARRQAARQRLSRGWFGRGKPSDD